MKRLADRPGSEHDTSPDPGASWRPYIVCATPRTGSYLLCRGLVSTGVAGVPLEYFNPSARRPLAARWGCGDSLGDYVKALRARRTARDGVCGMKLHWGQFESILAESLDRPVAEPPFTLDSGFLDSHFPDARYVFIRRLDVNRQAVSRWIAADLHVWEVGCDEPAPDSANVRYSFAGIERHRRQLLLWDLHWDRYFRLNGIRPLEVIYEDLVKDYEGVVRAVLAHLAPGAGPVAIGSPEARRLDEARADAFAERFGRDLVSTGGIEGPRFSERVSNRANHVAGRLTRGPRLP